MSYVIGQIAGCDECDKRWEDYNRQKARKAAYAHAMKTGHQVWVETITAIVYNRKN